MRLSDGTLWPVPIFLDISAQLADQLSTGDRLALRDPEGAMLAALTVEELFKLDKQELVHGVFDTLDPAHPGVTSLLDECQDYAVSGKLEGLQLPAHYDYIGLRLTPAELRQRFAKLGWQQVIGFHTRHPLHRAQVELTLRAAKQHQANLLLHPAVGMTKPGDVDHYTRVRCYQAVLERYPRRTAMLALLPLAMRMAGPREALLHAIIRKNCGCTHLIVGRSHASPPNGARTAPVYEEYAAQELVRQHEAELGITTVPMKRLVYLADLDRFTPADEVPAQMAPLEISPTQLRQRLDEGRELPQWFTFTSVARELRRTYLPRSKQGFTVFFTGLSGAGKSTIAKVIQVRLLELGGRPVTLLDGDIVRHNLSSELGFSKEHRDINIRRIGFVASEITKNGGIAICAPIAPYEKVRREVSNMITPVGGYILVHVATPLEICEQRDRKGLYAKARAGTIQAFTGISDPYEVPEDADLHIDTVGQSPQESAQLVMLYLERKGYIGCAEEPGD